MSVQSSPINQRFVILLQCLSEVWYEVHCFFAQNPASFMNDYLVKKRVDLHMYRYKIQMHSDSVCHCKHGSGDLFALLWKELWLWWVHLNYEDASMVIADQAEPPAQCFRAAQLFWKKRLSWTTICKIWNKKVIHNDIMLITRMLGWLRIKQSSALEPPAKCSRAAQLL